MGAEPQWDFAPHAAGHGASPAARTANADESTAAQTAVPHPVAALNTISAWSAGDSSDASSPPDRGVVVALKRVHRSHGNRYVQRVVAQRQALQRSCSCGTCEQCRAREQVAPPPVQSEELRPVLAQARGDVLDDASDRDSLVPENSASRPLDANTRHFMEERFGTDFTDVRIHDDESAARANDALGAEAFTSGRDIYFARGAYAPDTEAGQHLLAHELAHTVQQSEGAVPVNVAAQAQDGTIVGAADDPLEHEADAMADHVVGRTQEGSVLSTDPSGAVRAEFSLRDTAIGRGLRFVGGKAQAAAAAGKEFLLEQVERFAPGVLEFLRGLRTYLKDKISAGFDSLFSGLAGRLRRDGLSGALDYLIGDLAGGALKSLGELVAGKCAALGETAELLLDIGKRFGGEALARISKDAAGLAAFFSDVWTKYGAPALTALKTFAGDVWRGITKKLSEIWDKLAPIRRSLREAWDYLIGAFLEGKSQFDDWLDDLYAKATKKWEEIKEELKPHMNLVRGLIGILALLSPLGPIVAVGLVAYGLYTGVKYVWEHWGKPKVAELRAKLVNEVLPGILGAVDKLRTKLDEAKAWLSGLAEQLAAKGVALLEAIGAMPLLAFARSLISDVSARFDAFAEKVRGKLKDLAARIGQFLAGVRAFLAPFLEFYRQVVLIGLTGPFAILDDGVWASVVRIVRIGLTVPCIREVAQLARVPALMEQAAEFRVKMKAIWKIISNPDPIIQALHDGLVPLVEQVPGVAASMLSSLIYPDETRHREGVEHHLAKAIDAFGRNWWTELKKMGWMLLWPWDEVGERFKPMIKDGSDAIAALLNLEISLAIDKFLKMMQGLNAILGALWGWFALAAVLIGATLGALGVEFTAGASIAAGAQAGWAVAETVGLVLLGAAAATELAVMAKSMTDLRFTNTVIADPLQRIAEDENDYASIAGSVFGLTLMAVLIILGGIVINLIKAFLSFIWESLPNAITKAVENFLSKERGRPQTTTDTTPRSEGGEPARDPNEPLDRNQSRKLEDLDPATRREFETGSRHAEQKVRAGEGEPGSGQFKEFERQVAADQHKWGFDEAGDWCALSTFTCGRGSGAASRASRVGIARRIKMAYERMRAGEYDPLQDHLTPDQREAFMDFMKAREERAPKDLLKDLEEVAKSDTDWHHTMQTAADPAMADVAETVQPTSRKGHFWDEHPGNTQSPPTAGIRGDVTTKERPIFDPNAPEEQTARFNPQEPVETDPLPDLSTRELGRKPPSFREIARPVTDPALSPRFDLQMRYGRATYYREITTGRWYTRDASGNFVVLR
jgi:hypothetical protein